ncbi:MAG: outer membrane protein assembly factor BamD [Candidatus Rokuibacteriota bacterium]
MTGGRWALALLVVLASACSTAKPAPRPSPSPWMVESHERGGSAAAARLIAQADDLVERGQTQAAGAVYERVVREHPEDPAAASALYGLGRLQADPAGRLRNYRAAHAAFSRLLAEYPHSRWEAEARAWRGVLRDLLAREEESARLKSQIERLRQTDLDLERRR